MVHQPGASDPPETDGGDIVLLNVQEIKNNWENLFNDVDKIEQIPDELKQFLRVKIERASQIAEINYQQQIYSLNDKLVAKVEENKKIKNQLNILEAENKQAIEQKNNFEKTIQDIQTEKNCLGGVVDQLQLQIKAKSNDLDRFVLQSSEQIKQIELLKGYYCEYFNKYYLFMNSIFKYYRRIEEIVQSE